MRNSHVTTNNKFEELRTAAAATADAKSGRWFYFTLNNIEYFKKLDASTKSSDRKLKAILLGLIDASMHNSHEHQANRIIKYYGMPEYEGISLDKDELIAAGRNGAIAGLRRFDLQKAESLREAGGKRGESQTAKSYVTFDSKHEMINLVVEKAKDKYPAMSAYYQQLLVLTHKGGISDNIANHSAEEVLCALNTAAADNHEKTVAKREKQGRSYGAGMHFTLNQAKSLLQCVTSVNEPSKIRRGRNFLDCVGETYTHKASGQKMVITEHHGYKDVTVKFEDGEVRTGVNYKAVKNGTVLKKNVETRGRDKKNIRKGEQISKNSKKTNHNKGERYVHKKTGLMITITDYRSFNDVDIEFEDGTIKTGCNYKAVKDGTIKYPNK